MAEVPADGLALVTYDEAAARLGVEPARVRQWARRHGLTKIRTDTGRVLLVEREVLACERDRRRSGRVR